MKYVFVCCFVFLFTSCIATMDVQYDETLNVKKYKTYSFYPVIDSNLPETETKQIMQLITFQLFKLNYKKADNPDFYINFFVEENNMYIPKPSEEEPETETPSDDKTKSNTLRLKTVAIDQVMYLDVVDVKNDQLAWSAIIEGSIEEPITEEKMFQYYSEKIEKAFIKFQEVSN